MIKDFQVRLYEKGDEKGIVELLKLAFPVWAKNDLAIDHWRWKYLDAPLQSVVVVATGDGNIIGVNHDMSFKTKIGSSILLSQFGSDAATHPDYRGMGVYTKIITLSDVMHDKLGIQFECAQSINPTINKSWERRQHVRFPHDISYMVRIRDIDLHLKMRPLKNSSLMRISYRLVEGFNKIKNDFNPISMSGDFQITETSSIDERFEVFWLRAKDNYGFIYEKDANYLRWNYIDKRAGNYIVKQAIRGNEVLGFSVLNLLDDEYKEGFIFELMALPEKRCC